jgi:hypothetical protein
MREHPKEIGERSQLAVVLALRAAGYGVLLPLGENTRYDLAIEDAGAVFLVQCKTGRLKAGAVCFRTASSYYHHPNPKAPKHYRGQVDFFAIYCLETGKVYLVPIGAVDAVDYYATLRVDPPRNNQVAKVRWASDFEVGSVAVVTTGLRVPAGAR